jgi:hypothetical protein
MLPAQQAQQHRWIVRADQCESQSDELRAATARLSLAQAAINAHATALELLKQLTGHDRVARRERCQQRECRRAQPTLVALDARYQLLAVCAPQAASQLIRWHGLQLA